MPHSSHCSAGEYCYHVVHCSLPGVWCVGGECVSALFVWWGVLCPLPPRSGGGWGYRWVVGGMARWGGMALKGGCCDGGPPVCVLVSPLVCVVAVLNGGSGACCVVPVLFMVFPVLCVAVGKCGGACGGACGGLCSRSVILFPLSIPRLVSVVTALLV